MEIGRLITKISPSKNRTCDFHRIRLKHLIFFYLLLMSDHLINLNLSELVSKLLFKIDTLPEFIPFLISIILNIPLTVLCVLLAFKLTKLFQSK